MRKQWRMANGEWGVSPSDPRCAPTSAPPPSPFPLPHSHPRPRGITLIELLITMVIIAIVSAAILGTAAAAMENARRSRTQSLITKISGLVLERWDSYSNRRVELNPLITGSGSNPPANSIEGKFLAKQISPVERGQMLADARLLALRELMMMEMPDRWSDVTNGPIMLASVPPLTRTYFRRVGTDENQLAECLYLTVMYATGDGEARTLFSSQDIGDTDEDGAPEFLDGWGRPIQWIRWPAGYVSPLQQRDDNGNRDAEDHDPFDIFRRDLATVSTPALDNYPPLMRSGDHPPIDELRARNQQLKAASTTQLAAFRLVPLIFSGGPDEGSALRIQKFDIPASMDPYYLTTDMFQSGEVDPDSEFTATDNITNHLNEY